MTEAIIVTSLHCLTVTLFHRSYFQLLIQSNLQSCLCQYVKDLMPAEGQSGEYRGRTDDLLHAMQAL